MRSTSQRSSSKDLLMMEPAPMHSFGLETHLGHLPKGISYLIRKNTVDGKWKRFILSSRIKFERKSIKRVENSGFFRLIYVETLFMLFHFKRSHSVNSKGSLIRFLLDEFDFRCDVRKTTTGLLFYAHKHSEGKSFSVRKAARSLDEK